MSTTTPTTTAPTEQRLPAGTWQLDPVHSHAGFAVKHMVVSTFRGRFEELDARLTVDEAGNGELVGSVKGDSIVVKDPNLAGHLKAPDFFDTERYPELRFASSSVRREGDKLLLDGELTIKEHTHPVHGEGTIVDAHDDPFGGQRLGLQLETTVDRTQYGLEWNAPLPKGGFALADDVVLALDLELVRAA